MNRVWLVIALLCTSLLSFSIASAQTDGTTWYWAIDPEEGDITAYTVDAENRVLGNVGLPTVTRAWRTSPQRGFAIFSSESGEEQLYRLSPDSVEPVEMESEIAIGRFVPLYIREHVTVLINHRTIEVGGRPTSPIFVLNNDTLEGWFLSNVFHSMIGVDDDGHTLRFTRVDVIEATNDEISFNLAELDSDTGEMRDVFAFPPQTQVVNLSKTGEFFLFFTTNPETRDRAIFRGDPSGNIEQLARYSRGDEIAYTAFLVDYSDGYVLYDSRCQTDCIVSAYTFGSNESTEFAMTPSVGIFTPVRFYMDDSGQIERLVAIHGLDIWMLSSDGGNQHLAERHPEYREMPSDIYISNGRYLLTTQAEGENHFSYALWDLQATEKVLESDRVPNGSRILAHLSRPDDGVIVVELPANDYRLYQNGEIINLPGGRISEGVLPGGEVLMTQVNRRGGLSLGIYRYSAETRQYTSLVADAIPINMQEASPR